MTQKTKKVKQKIDLKEYLATTMINEFEDILDKDNLDSEYKIPILKYLINKWRGKYDTI